MGFKTQLAGAALRFGALSNAQKVGVAILPVAPIVLTAESCHFIGNFDAVHVTGEHVDVWGTNHYERDNGQQVNIVWWHEEWHKKYFINGEWVWRYNGAEWVQRHCYRYDQQGRIGDNPDSPCYNVWGVQLYVSGPDTGRMPG